MKTIDERMNEKRTRAEALQKIEELEVRVFESGQRLERARSEANRIAAEYANAVRDLRDAENVLSNKLAALVNGLTPVDRA
jgi:hypothetical protein